MKTLSSFFVILMTLVNTYGQQPGVYISATPGSPNSSALLDINSNNQGILIPRMTTAEMTAISSPSQGLLIYNTDSICFCFFTTSWKNMCTGATNMQNYPRILSYGIFSGQNILANGFIDQEALVIGNSWNLYVHIPNEIDQYRDIRNDWASAGGLSSYIIVNGKLYILVNSSTTHRIYMYDLYNINSGGTLVTLTGQALGTSTSSAAMTSDGTNVYLTHNANNSTNDYVIAKYSMTNSSTFAYQSSITCSAPNGVRRLLATSSGKLFLFSNTGSVIYVINSSNGNSITTYNNYIINNTTRLLNWNDHIYIDYSSGDNIMDEIFID